MNFFDGKFDFIEVADLGANRYKVKGRFTNNTGLHSPTDVSVGDIIYGISIPTGNPVLRYKITELHFDEFFSNMIVATIEWDMIPGIAVVPPYEGMEGIIGALQNNGLTANITSPFVNNANILLVNYAQSYQTMLLGTLTGTPDLRDILRRLGIIEDEIKGVQIEWENNRSLSPNSLLFE